MMHDVHTNKLRIKNNKQYKSHSIRSWACKSQNSLKLDFHVAPSISNTLRAEDEQKGRDRVALMKPTLARNWANWIFIDKDGVWNKLDKHHDPPHPLGMEPNLGHNCWKVPQLTLSYTLLMSIFKAISPLAPLLLHLRWWRTSVVMRALPMIEQPLIKVDYSSKMHLSMIDMKWLAKALAKILWRMLQRKMGHKSFIEKGWSHLEIRTTLVTLTKSGRKPSLSHFK